MKTKGIWMIVAILAVCGNALSAQENKHEIAIAYGAGTNSEIINIFEDIISVSALATFGSKYKTDNDKSIGSVSVEYFYRLSGLVGVGAIAAYGKRTMDISIDGTPYGKMKSNYYTLMPAMKLDWIHSPYFGLYSKLAAGVTCRSEKNGELDYSESKSHFNWQVSLLGLEAGGRALRGFAELGVGEQGIILAGLRYKF